MMRGGDTPACGRAGTLKRSAAVCAAVFLLFGPYIATYFAEPTRYFSMWRRMDGVILLGVVFLLAGLGVAIGSLVRRSGRPTLVLICEHLFVLALAGGLLANLHHHLGAWAGIHLHPSGIVVTTIWFSVVSVVVYSFGRRSSRLPSICSRVGLIVSPGIVIVAISLLLKRPFDNRQDAIAWPAAEAHAVSTGDSGDHVPVYIFVFDEWSAERTFTNGRVNDEYPNIAAFAKQAVIFENAHSPGVFTKGIMPRFLFQTDLQPVFQDGEVGFVEDGRFLPAGDFPSLFSTFSRRGYETVMIGAYLPYAAWLGDQVDVCRSYSLYPLGENMLERAARDSWNAMCYWTDPWSQTVTLRYKLLIRDIDMLRVYEGMDSDIAAIVSRPPTRTFAVFHYMLPHEPYILEPDGRYRGPAPDVERSDVGGYLRNLKRLDVLVGEFVGIMERAGTFSRSMVVLTSDHSWRWDPARQGGGLDAPRTHVPLLIKLPLQREPVNVPQKVQLQDIGVLLAWGIGAEARPERVKDFVDTGLRPKSHETAGVTLFMGDGSQPR